MFSRAAQSRGMEHLSTLDAGFLEAEDSDRHVSLAIGAVSVIEGPMPDYDALAAGVAERILAVPRFRQVLRTHLLDLDPPEWVEDPNLDLSHHIHRAALPHPGDDEALFRFAADVMERRLDRDRPLWECWVIEGLAGGRWAILMKIHHCIADGIATMHLVLGAERRRRKVTRSQPRFAPPTSLRKRSVSTTKRSVSIRWIGRPVRGVLPRARQAQRYWPSRVPSRSPVAC